jgi:ubiquinone/menaquinone biosynthesis C-methylase UbiE
VEIDRQAQSFDSAATAYERGRPGYPAEALDRVVAELGLTSDATIVDLAAGTGKLTRDLVARFARVIAVEPLDRMRAQLATTVPEAESLHGDAHGMPIDTGAATAVFVGQAFHWFSDHEALAEIARVLQPAGAMVLIWNTSPWEIREGSWFVALADLLEDQRLDRSGLHRHTYMHWHEIFATDKRFEPLSHASFAHAHELSRADFIETMASRSYIASLDAGRQAEVLAAIDGLFERDDAPMDDGRVEIPLRTDVFWTRKR